MLRARPAAQAGVAVAHGCCGVGTAFCRPLTRTGRASANSRDSSTTAEFCGAASGTLMTSIRHFDGLAPVGVFGVVAVAAGELGVRDAAPAVPIT